MRCCRCWELSSRPRRRAATIDAPTATGASTAANMASCGQAARGSAHVHAHVQSRVCVKLG
eukprot:4072189-Prymnesium_polylepis.2